jgi:hypothetical protein
MGESKRKRQAEAARQIDGEAVVHAVVHKPSRSSDRHADTEARAAYRREWMRLHRAAERTVEIAPAVVVHAVVHEPIVVVHKPTLALVIEDETSPSDMIDTGTPSLKPTWTAPAVRELHGAEAEIQRAYSRFRPDHPMHRHAPDYAPDYTGEGARVLTWVPPAPAPQTFTLAEAA